MRTEKRVTGSEGNRWHGEEDEQEKESREEQTDQEAQPEQVPQVEEPQQAIWVAPQTPISKAEEEARGVPEAATQPLIRQLVKELATPSPEPTVMALFLS